MHPEFSKEDVTAKIHENVDEAHDEPSEKGSYSAGYELFITKYKKLLQKCAELERENKALTESANKDTPFMEQLKEWGDMFTHIGEMSDKEFAKVSVEAKSETSEIISKTEAICKGVERILIIVERTGMIERVLTMYRKYFELMVRVVKRSKLHTIVVTFSNMFKGKGKK